MGKQKNEQTPAPISKGALVGGIFGAAFGISADEVRIDGNGISLHNVKIGGKFGKKKNYKD